MRTKRTLKSQCLVAAAIGFVVVACGEQMGVGTTSPLAAAVNDVACPELARGAMNAMFDEDARANATIGAFVTASGDLAAIAVRVQAEVAAACERMAADLGVTEGEQRGRTEQDRLTSKCNAVAGRIDAIARQGASGQIRAQVTPPQCQVNAAAEAQCKARCSAQLDPGNVKATCAPGHLYGKCTGTCTGMCTGVCNGTCQGQTSAGGQCSGTCKGTCSGDCKGHCSVDFQEPKCDVQGRAPSADARCDGSCKAHADFVAQCSDPRVQITGNVNTGELARVAATLERNLPPLIKAEVAYGQRIGEDVQVLVRTGVELPHAFRRLSAHAGACVGAAANATVAAQASLRVSVQASATVTARAGGARL